MSRWNRAPLLTFSALVSLTLTAADVPPAVDDTGTRLLQLRRITLVDLSKIEKRISQSTILHRSPLNRKYSS